MSFPSHHDRAPADARAHAPWSTWRKLLAYVVLAAAAAFGIWLVDVKSKLGEVRQNNEPAAHAQVLPPLPCTQGRGQG